MSLSNRSFRVVAIMAPKIQAEPVITLYVMNGSTELTDSIALAKVLPKQPIAKVVTIILTTEGYRSNPTRNAVIE